MRQNETDGTDYSSLTRIRGNAAVRRASAATQKRELSAGGVVYKLGRANLKRRENFMPGSWNFDRNAKNGFSRNS
jgi:hypothetical protein